MCRQIGLVPHVSLAFADLIVLVSAVPDAIVFHHIGIRFVSGQVGCSLMIFGNFLGINAGSLSILAFTMERYIAVMHPLKAQKVCTVERANKVIVAVWIFAVLYCSPWLGLTQITRPYPDKPDLPICDFRLSKDQYVYFFSADLLLFYILPLIVCAFVYIRIWYVFRRQKNVERSGSFYSHSSHSNNSLHLPLNGTLPRLNSTSFVAIPKAVTLNGTVSVKAKNGERSKALTMLIVVVLLFAVCWLPFRGLLVYNSFTSTPWLDIWYLLFAKTLIYINSAINPFLYNAMSAKFRSAVYQLLHLRKPVPEICLL
ncbi:thyrotropin-releasing hormone receptor-like isoform X2 [Paramacrobiotus metropolitanus]|uniref:thyrotropin-releasing hormone receptor-like isoform X2 n=1 Tax=Paramacrobiotus metropolitanus TaxID=2943436 RepID=UPI002445BB4B|nr:thyrotropin-releasing hormone receptor-like isoform X2 [Paramacrobiotus metropolitanus]